MHTTAAEVTAETCESSIEKFVYLDGKFFDRINDRTSWVVESFNGQAWLVATSFFVHDICGGSLRLEFRAFCDACGCALQDGEDEKPECSNAFCLTRNSA